MKQYSPPINKREIGELWLIASDDGTEWQQDAIEQATLELRKRGATNQEFIDNKANNIEFRKRLEKIHKNEIRKRKIESYSKTEMLTIIILSPLFIIKGSSTSKGLFQLKSEQYNLKFRQRLLCLIIGISIWAALLFVAIKYPATNLHNPKLFIIKPKAPSVS